VPQALQTTEALPEDAVLLVAGQLRYAADPSQGTHRDLS
jgi:hypothetical protein